VTAVDRDWTAIFQSTFASPGSAVQERVWREVFGEEYPEGVEPYSYTSRSELSRIATELDVGPGDVFADIGCGRGGPGLRVAASTGAQLVGVDIADSALSAASARAHTLGLGADAEYRLGAFDHLPIDDASVDGAMSIDALLFAPSKHDALVEVARAVRPGGRLAMTTWDYHSQPVGRPAQVDDHRPLLVAAGFDILTYDETPSWRERQDRVDALLLDAVDELAAESGDDPAEVRASIEEMHATVSTILRRVLFVACRL
jgi:SAM-dependent methyltransferase